MKSYDKNTRSTNSLPITDGSRKKQYTYIRYKGNQWPPACCIKNYIPLLTHSLQKVMSDKINILRAKYQIDQMEIASREEHNKFITGILTGSILLVFIFIIITIMLRKQRQEIALSTQKLEHLRTNAENATSAKSIFLSNMSHEIRTPLNALSGFSSLLTEENLDNETRRQCNEVILQNSELLLKLIN